MQPSFVFEVIGLKGIYVHIPFCIKKCNYCDFASYSDKFDMQYRYADAVLSEMERYSGTEADTVYIGGGTPTSLNADCMERLLSGINRIFKLHENTEFTVEANPKTVDVQKAELMKKCGVNRISLGAQSFIDSELKFLGRIHSAADTKVTFELLRSCGFDNINLDIMYAFEGQSERTLSTSLDEVLKLGAEHISCYGLKIEPKTLFYNMLRENKIRQTDDDIFADMYNLICAKLHDNGYVHYEISNFSRRSMESRHNLKYWNCEDYLGFGASAASCVGRRRFTNSPRLDEYLNGCVLSEDYTMSDEEAMREFVILGLRVINTGVNKEEFYKRFSLKFDDVFSRQIKKFKDFLTNDEKSLGIKETSALVSNAIMCEFM